MYWTKRSGGRMRNALRVLTPEPWSTPSLVDDMSGTDARVPAWLDRVGIRTSAQRDAVAAGTWAVLSAAVLTLLLAALAVSNQFQVQLLQSTVIVGLGIVQCLLLIIRQVQPITCLLIVSALQVVFSAVLPPQVVLLSAAPIVVAYTVGLLLTPRLLVSAIAFSLGLQVVGAIVVTATGLFSGRVSPGVMAAAGEGIVATVSPALLMIAAASVGAWVALSREQRRMISARAAASVEYQAVLTNAAVAAERTRMARELHDIAAHHLSALIVQAGAAERIVHSDPDLAKETIREIRNQGRATLADMRSIVGILRDTDGDARPRDGNIPIPGIAQLETLIVAARASGDRIEWQASGPAVVLPPLADVTTYRIAQEALANARRHAATVPVTVYVTATPARFVLEIENALTNRYADDTNPTVLATASGQSRDSSGPTHGLLGMRERAALVGATLTTGATRRDTWRVRFELPLDNDSASADTSIQPIPSGRDR